MKKTTIAFSLLCSVMFTQVQADNNYIECQRNKASFKQFCNIKGQADIVSIDIAKSFAFGNSNLDISNTLAEGAITSDGLTGESLVLASLRPQIQFTTDWNDAAECLDSSLWKDEIYIGINDKSKVKQVQPSRLYPGLDSQTINLALFATDTFKPWNQTGDEASIRLESNISVFNRSHYEERPLSSSRIPLECNLTLLDILFYFDENSINQDLATLKDRAEAIVQNLNQPLNPESEAFIAAKANLENIMLGAFAVTAIAKAQRPDYLNPQWMSLDSITTLF